MKLQVGDIFVEVNTDNTGNIGLVVSKKEEYPYHYCIDWTNGRKGHYTKNEISYWLDNEKIIHFPVIK